MSISADKYGVQNTPTMKIIVSEEAVDELYGNDLDGIKSLIAKYITVKSFAKRCNFDENKRPRCENSHIMRVIDNPVERVITGGIEVVPGKKLFCNCCQGLIVIEDGYYNCETPNTNVSCDTDFCRQCVTNGNSSESLI